MIGVIITTIDRPSIVLKSIASTEYLSPIEYKVILIEQTNNTYDNISNVHRVKVPYDVGLSYSRNIGVEVAYQLGCDYCLVMADSICLTEEIQQYIQWIMSLFNTTEFDLIGLPLINRVSWEGKLQLIAGKGFKIDMVSPYSNHLVTPCDIVRNFFIAKIKTLRTCQWDNDLKMREHEDFFWRYKQLGYKVGFITVGSGKYIGRAGTPEYTALRDRNMIRGRKLLKAKYHIADWLVR
jgi:hypothetical protein